MKRFRFSLEKVLEYREQVESQRVRTFAVAAEVFRRRREELAALADELALYKGRLAEMGVGRADVRELTLYRTYLGHCEMKVATAVEWLRDAAREMEARREEMVRAGKDRRVIERFKEIKREHYDYEAQREETKELDEIGTRGFVSMHAGAGEAATERTGAGGEGGR